MLASKAGSQSIDIRLDIRSHYMDAQPHLFLSNS